MADGFYQSLIVWFFAYLIFRPANFVNGNGLDLGDNTRIGVYVATTAVVVVNIYVLFNTYRWDWLMLLIVAISILLIWFWTGVYTSFTVGFTFYKAAPQVYGTLSFWANLLVVVVICLLPRFVAKAYQKVFLPRDVDIIREQVTQGKFDYLDDEPEDTVAPPEKRASQSSSTSGTLKNHSTAGMEHPSPDKADGSRNYSIPHHDTDSTRPMYPPSIAPTQATTTRNTRSNNGSDGTDYTGHVISNEQQQVPKSSFERERTGPRPSFDRVRPSFDRARQSMDKIRPSFEASSDFTSAAGLMRMESSHSQNQQQQPVKSPSRLRRMTFGRGSTKETKDKDQDK